MDKEQQDQIIGKIQNLAKKYYGFNKYRSRKYGELFEDEYNQRNFKWFFQYCHSSTKLDALQN
ncbi:MAG: hypothetical protein PHD13_01910 [Methanocellales archaeon]|nr:hypothetical protein [Methanocellales archaeon]MDD3291034.1 hypothetical protein [Methanocellales archaeon]MDD5234919.1 hypothetical protein [Methanocellales archaeon]MDD5484711.1 hypothetical protein [Methanocellales archaeon]